jgi:hypothetical protein
VITITAELLCKRAVIKVPVNIPFNGVLVSLINHVFNLLADKLNKPNRIIIIPKINIKIQSMNNNMYSILPAPSLHSMALFEGTC